MNKFAMNPKLSDEALSEAVAIIEGWYKGRVFWHHKDEAIQRRHGLLKIVPPQYAVFFSWTGPLIDKYELIVSQNKCSGVDRKNEEVFFIDESTTPRAICQAVIATNGGSLNG